MIQTGDVRDSFLGEYDVVVIGAGITGSMMTRELSKYKVRIALCEKEPFPGQGPSKGSYSMIHAPNFCPSATFKGTLCVHAARRYKELSAELEVTYGEVDELRLAFEPAQLPLLEDSKKRGEEYGGADFEIIGPDQIFALEPNLNPQTIAALHVRGLGVVHPPEWAFALIENAAQNGARIYLDTPVVDIRPREGGGYLVQTSRGTFGASFIVNAAGLFVGDVAAMVGDEGIQLKISRGTNGILDKSFSHLVRNTIYGPRPGQVITPTAHGNLMVMYGTFVADHREDTRVTREGIQEMIKMGKELVPSLPEREFITFFTGLRSENNLVPNADFYIARSERSPGVIHAVIGSPGVTTAPAVADRIIALLGEAGLSLKANESFQGRRRGWARFAKASLEEKEALIRKNPLYGHVLCRCETVTKAEILEVIRRGATTLDGIKHLTRAGMGRCQGGFCGPKVIRLLAEELGVSPVAVTKKGAGSSEILFEAKELLGHLNTKGSA